MPAAEEYGAKARFPVCEVDQVDALVVGRAGGERRPEATLDSTRVGCAMKMVACARRLEVLSEQPRLQGVSLEGVVRRVDIPVVVREDAVVCAGAFSEQHRHVSRCDPIVPQHWELRRPSAMNLVIWQVALARVDKPSRGHIPTAALVAAAGPEPVVVVPIKTVFCSSVRTNFFLFWRK